MRLVLLALLATQPACESCEWSFGSITVAGTLAIKGPPPTDLKITACEGPRDDDDCDSGSGLVSPGEVWSYRSGFAPTGVFSCSFNERWLVFTATGCERYAIQILAHDDVDAAFADAAKLDLEHVDVTLHCGMSSAGEI